MKKFLTVLLALSVVFTYSFSAVGSVFAATKTPVEQLADAITDAQKTIAYYDGSGYMKTGDDFDDIISKTVVDARIAELKDTLNTDAKIEAAFYDYGEGIAKESFIAILFDATSWTADDGYTYSYTNLINAQWKVDKAAASIALSPDLREYTEADQQAIKAAITAQKTAFDTANQSSDKLAGIKAFRKIVTDMKAVMESYSKADESAASVVAAKRDVLKYLDAKADAFKDAVKSVSTFKAAQIAKQKSVESDVLKVVAFFEEKIDAIVANENTTDATKKTALNGVKLVVDATFAIPGTGTAASAIFSGAFYDDLATIESIDIYKTYAKEIADQMKAERKTDGTLKYAAKDVDKAYNDALTKVADVAYEVVAGTLNANKLNKSVVDKVMATVKEQDFPLQAYKEQAIDNITTGTYDLSNWSGERYAKVAAIQEKAEEDILLAENIADVDAIVKKAIAEMKAILTDDQIDDLEAATENRIRAAGYQDAFEKYFDVVIGTKGYSSKTKADAVENAKQVLKDAVVAKEDAKLTYAEIDTIIKDKTNYDAAIAALGDVKTDTERLALAKVVDDMIKSLPTVVTITDKENVLAAQKAYDDYLDLAGAKIGDLSYAKKMQSSLQDLMDIEAKAVRDQIRALPSVVTVNDAAAIEAARAALDAYEETYGDYDGYSAPSNVFALEALEKALEKAKVKDAADKVAALGANPTKAEVEAARAAYDALSTRSKLSFNEELYADLLKAEKEVVSSGIYAVKSLKITTSTKLYKGSKIRVKWTVKGDASVADGYQVYKSTKAHKNYKFMGKTKKTYMDNKKGLKKGTRYFYKVRAFVEIDGQKYYSDWSNKGNRIYKK